MRKNLIFCTLVTITLFSILQSQPTKIIGLIPVRNEQALIALCLRSLALYTDAIVVLDDASEDNTLAIIESLAQECHVEKIIRKKVWVRDEPGDKTVLLKAGRELGGTHFIVIDADEMLCAPCAQHDVLKNYIKQLNPGDRLCIRFYELWGSIDHYREEQPKHIACIFCDDGQARYIFSTFIHTSRHPNLTSGANLILENDDFALLHFDCVDLARYAIKQTWYRCLERVQVPAKLIADINAFYNPDRLKKEMPLYPTKAAWFDYPFFNKNALAAMHTWHEKQMQQWIATYGKDYFAGILGIEEFLNQSSQNSILCQEEQILA